MDKMNILHSLPATAILKHVLNSYFLPYVWRMGWPDKLYYLPIFRLTSSGDDLQLRKNIGILEGNIVYLSQPYGQSFGIQSYNSLSTNFSTSFPSVVSHAVQWPAGKYGLPMAKSGCPNSNGFSWETGYIYQDLEDNNSLSGTSSSFHLRASVFSSGDVSQSFCIKTNKSSDQSRLNWPAGEYCIYKKGSICPTLLLEGWVLWDDENGQSGVNLNHQYGTVPGGTYNQDTKIKFCCQTIGSTYDPIELPIESPFYLIAFNNKRCQEVLKTIHTVEFIRYDTENDLNHNSQSYPYPFGADLSDPYIYYCYYQGKPLLIVNWVQFTYPRHIKYDLS